MKLLIKKISNLNIEAHNVRVLKRKDYETELSTKMKSVKISKKMKKESDRFNVIFFNQNLLNNYGIKDDEILNINLSSVYLVNKQIPTYKKLLYSIESLVDKLNIDPLYINEYSKKNLYVIGISSTDKEKIPTDNRRKWKTWFDLIPSKTDDKKILSYLISTKNITNCHIHDTNLNNRYDCNMPLIDVYKSMKDYTKSL